MTLYSDVARTIAREIEINVAPEEERRLASVRPVDPEAYEAYLKGQFHWAQDGSRRPRDGATVLSSQPWRKTRLRPGLRRYRLVWATLSQFGLVPRSEAHPKAKAAALRAVELDSNLAMAHYALGVRQSLGRVGLGGCG